MELKSPPVWVDHFQVDHDHGCCSAFKSCHNCWRGLLIARCHRVRGFADDDEDLLMDTARYVQHPHVALPDLCESTLSAWSK